MSWPGEGMEDWSRASPLDESKLWLLRREDIIGREEGPWEGGLRGEARHGLLGTLGMLGDRSRLGMLLRSLSVLFLYNVWFSVVRLEGPRYCESPLSEN